MCREEVLEQILRATAPPPSTPAPVDEAPTLAALVFNSTTKTPELTLKLPRATLSDRPAMTSSEASYNHFATGDGPSTLMAALKTSATSDLAGTTPIWRRPVCPVPETEAPDYLSILKSLDARHTLRMAGSLDSI
jgi:hypothetical protein